MPEGPHSCRVEIGLRLEPAAPREPVSDPVPSRLAPTTAAPVLLAASCFWARSVRCCKQRTIALSDHRGAATAGRLRCGTAKVATQTSDRHLATFSNRAQFPRAAGPAPRRRAKPPPGRQFTGIGAPPARLQRLGRGRSPRNRVPLWTGVESFARKFSLVSANCGR